MKCNVAFKVANFCTEVSDSRGSTWNSWGWLGWVPVAGHAAHYDSFSQSRGESFGVAHKWLLPREGLGAALAISGNFQH